jgi:glycosyltransferase involved in cell wall biosynthesis
MSLTVVSLAYPVVPIGPETVGGTEQVASMLDEALVAAGHRSIVIAAENSRVAGILVPTPSASTPLEPEEWEQAYAVHREALARVLRTTEVDVVHLHGIDFHRYLPEPGPPALATLHLPRFNYTREMLQLNRPLTFLNCVSDFSRQRYATNMPMAVIPYGVRLDRFYPRWKKGDFILALGRIVREKGFHLALDAAREAGVPLLLGGKVPPFPEHEQYFEEEIRPRLDSERRFLGPLPLAQRIELLAEARCVVIPSIPELMEETGPLVAMEALASGTPVVAQRAGALVDNIEHGRTGLFADDVGEMAAAFEAIDAIDPQECRRVACERFSSTRMVRSYLEVYEMLSAMARLETQWRELWQPRNEALAYR